MDFSEFTNGSVLACGLHGGDTCIVIVGCYGDSDYPHRVVAIDGRTWECSNAGHGRRHAIPHVASFHGVLLGEHMPAGKSDFTDRLTTIEQQLADIKAAQKSSAELLMLASRLIDAIDGKPPQQANPSLCSDAGVVSFSVNPSVRTLDLIKALGNAVATFGLRLECSYNSKLVVYEIKIEMPQ